MKRRDRCGASLTFANGENRRCEKKRPHGAKHRCNYHGQTVTWSDKEK